MPGIAYAQGGGGAAGPSQIINLLPFALMFVILYVLLIRPQQKRARDHETMIQNLKRNDEIITNGGLYGKVQGIADKVLVIEIAPNVRVRLERSQVASVVRGGKPEASEGKEREKP